MKSTHYKYIRVSDHALKRLKERSGLNQSAAIKTSQKAFDLGLKHSECTGHLHKWISGVTRTSSAGSIHRIYGDKLWIFVKDKNNNEITLVTVMQVPSNLKKLVDTLMYKKKESIK